MTKWSDHIADRVADYEQWCRNSYAARQLPIPQERREQIRPRDIVWTIMVVLLAAAGLAEVGGMVALR
jgi:hypothetical protein